MSIFPRFNAVASLLSTIALRINLTSKKYCLSISSSLLGIVCNTVLSSAVSEFIVSRNIPSAIELILFSILSGLNVVASKRNCTLTFDASSSTISIPTSLRINPPILSLSSLVMTIFLFIFLLKFKLIMQAVGFAPGHITGFFKAEVEPRKPVLKGSIGAGFSIKKGVTTKVKVTSSEKCGFKIATTGYKPDDTQVSEFVASEFLKIAKENYFLDIEHEIRIPVGYGLGSSGAVALSLAFALNKALGTNLSRTKIGQIAHIAEIH